MFKALSEKFYTIRQKLVGSKKLTEENISQAVRDVRLALLEADVSYSVASTLVRRIKEKAIGKELIRSVKPAQQFTQIVHEELIDLMGKEESSLHLNGYPSVIMLCGLQGSGKTTHCVKLAHFLQKNKKKVLLAACDLQRPAAITQLETLAATVGIEVFTLEGEKKPKKVAKRALEKTTKEAFDILIVDTAGRLHVDEDLMEELQDIKKVLQPQEILFVANATSGQDAVNAAKAFDEKVSITGSILTMLDADARAGAAISIQEVTKKPLKFEGIGEKISDLQVFNPKSMADRILDMGDVINLVRRAKTVMDEKESKDLETKIKKASFTFNDYLKQMRMIKKMGSLKSLLKMIPGVSSMAQFEMSEEELKKIEAMILSMTLIEREEKVDMSHSRRKRVAKGSGIPIDQINRMIKSFKRMKQFVKNMPMKKSLFKGGSENIQKQIEEINGLNDSFTSTRKA